MQESIKALVETFASREDGLLLVMKSLDIGGVTSPQLLVMLHPH